MKNLKYIFPSYVEESADLSAENYMPRVVISNLEPIVLTKHGENPWHPMNSFVPTRQGLNHLVNWNVSKILIFPLVFVTVYQMPDSPVFYKF